MTPLGDDLALTVETAPGPGRTSEALGQGLTEHALPFTHRAGLSRWLFARDRNGVLVGGCTAT